MARYVSLFSYTEESVKGMIDHPSDRTAAARALVESLGGTIEAFYWMLGPHDGLVISELPDSVKGAALWAAVGASGAISHVETYQLFDHDEQASIMNLAATALNAYKPPA